MMSRHAVPPEVRALIDEMLNGTISPDGVRRLEAALDENRAAQQFFREYCQLHINLDAETRAQRVVNEFKDRGDCNTPIGQSAGSPRSASSPSVVDTGSLAAGELAGEMLPDAPHSPSALSFISGLFSKDGGDFLSRPAVIATAVAGGLVALLVAIAIFQKNIAQVNDNPAPLVAQDPPQLPSSIDPARVVEGNVDPSVAHQNTPTDNQQSVFVAKITDSHNAQWAPANSQWAEPSGDSADRLLVAIGQRIELSRGLAEITFDVGAKVLIEGPAALTIDSATQATLAFGQLTAQVPEQAIGFTIETPMVNVVDLGTEFGVRVSPQGMTDVAVFSGKVVASPRSSGRSNTEEPVPVVADEVRRFWSGSIMEEEPLAAPNFTMAIPKAIPVENASFESPAIDGWLERQITGWTIVSQPAWSGPLNGGVQLVGPDREQLPATRSGKQWGFIETRKAAHGKSYRTSIHQAVGTVVPNTLYQLKVTIGYEAYTTHGLRFEFPFSWEGQDTFDVGLWAGDEKSAGPIEPLKVAHDPVPKLKPGKSETITVTYRSPADLPVGEQVLYIRMSLGGNDWCRVLFDDVQLEAVSIENNWVPRAAE
jgi:hypothetical protein